jgi:hypothetical protein
MRAGIPGNILGYTDYGHESHGQGIECDAQAVSREFPDQTICLVRQDGEKQWFQAGRQVDQPEWAEDWAVPDAPTAE